MSSINSSLVSKTIELLQQSPRTVYSATDLVKLYFQVKYEMRVPSAITAKKFLALLVAKKLFQELVPSSSYSNRPKRYVWGEFSRHELACSTHKDAYLSHGTAAFLWGLIDQEPKTIYVNKEQSIKPQSGRDHLTQTSINEAFARDQRQSKYVLRYGNWNVTLLSGKNSGRFGVQKTTGKLGEVLEVTGIERTLIDITVRPQYAGGVNKVLQCYVASKSLISAQTLIMTLRRMSYVYPYHQAVGFYMQTAGYDPASWSDLRKEELRYDFFLAHGIKNRAFNAEWRIFYPKGLHV